jgi:hypothetical protein
VTADELLQLLVVERLGNLKALEELVPGLAAEVSSRSL